MPDNNSVLLYCCARKEKKTFFCSSFPFADLFYSIADIRKISINIEHRQIYSSRTHEKSKIRGELCHQPSAMSYELWCDNPFKEMNSIVIYVCFSNSVFLSFLFIWFRSVPFHSVPILIEDEQRHTKKHERYTHFTCNQKINPKEEKKLDFQLSEFRTRKSNENHKMTVSVVLLLVLFFKINLANVLSVSKLFLYFTFQFRLKPIYSLLLLDDQTVQ